MPQVATIPFAPTARIPRPAPALARPGPVPPAGGALPEVILCRVIPTGGGEFRLRPIAKEWITLNRSTTEALGLEAAHYDTLRRLARAGFVRTRNVSQRVVQLHVPSWVAHLAAVEADPWFWEDPNNLTRWRLACGHDL